MGKFNKKTKLDLEPAETRNYEYGIAYTMSPKKELYERVVTCLLEPKFYDSSGEDTRNAILELINKMEEIDPEFVLKLASYSRNKMYLRSIPVFLLVEACKYPKMKSFVKKYTPHIIKRVDEITEAIAYYIQTNNIHIGDAEPSGMLCNALKKGIADTFHEFNEYQLAKYNRKGAVTLKDAIRITHPKPTDEEESMLWNRLVNDKLAIPETWETYISKHGSTKESWEYIIPKMPIMATIRNLRNFAKVGADISLVVDKLTNKDIILNSKQFPFRFYSAYKALVDSGIANYDIPKLLDALRVAIEISVDNLPKIKGKSFLLADKSGSMTNRPISNRSTIYPSDIAGILLAIAHRICEYSILGLFATDFTVVNADKKANIFHNMEYFDTVMHGGNTYGYKAIQWLLEKEFVIDRLILLSDMQLYTEENTSYGYLYPSRNIPTFSELWRKYVNTVNYNAKLYSINLYGYGTVQVPERYTFLISGWNENILKFINLIESEGIDPIKAIDNYKLQ